MKGLNKEQLEAAAFGEGPCMVLAGPGTGKTTIITARIYNLIRKKLVEPENILVVTFSRAAAYEMKARYEKLVGEAKARAVNFGTLHSVFYKILRQYKGYKLEDLIDEGQKFNVVRSILRKLDLEFSEDEEQLKDIINDMDYVTSTMTDIRDYEPSSCDKNQLRKIMNEYKEIKQSSGKYDYDDILSDCYWLLRGSSRILKEVRSKFKFILVDEFQDINILQFETIKLIAEPDNNIFVVGDDDQSIYGFRGAAPDILLNFEKLYPGCKKVFLRSNYRTTKNLLTSALSVINNNKKRYEKNLEAVGGAGNIPVTFEAEDSEEEARSIASRIERMKEKGSDYSGIAVIYRTNLQSRALIDAFMDANIPFVTLDGVASIYNHWIFKDITGYLKLGRGLGSNKELIRIMNKPKRFISKEALERADRIEGDFLDNLITYCGLNRLQVNAVNELRNDIARLSGMNTNNAVKYIRNVISYDEYLREYAGLKRINARALFDTIEEIESSTKGFKGIEQYLQHIDEVCEKSGEKTVKDFGGNQVKLLTMHRAKGLEFDTVFICGSIEGLTPYVKGDSSDGTDFEEERRLFYVAMTRAKKELFIAAPRKRYGKQAKPSRFINEIYKNTDYDKQVYIGQRIFHKIYYEGVIREIDGTGESTRIKVDFAGVIKDLKLKTCLQNEIIRLI
ncbi:MAG: ATP-dependent helicase [Caulobacteraceae bacterium]